MFSRYFSSFVPGLPVRPQNNLPGFNLDENSFPKAEQWRDAISLGPQAQRYPDAAPALKQQILRFPAPSSQFFEQSTPPIGLVGFRPATQNDIPGFRLMFKDAVPGFNLIDNESGGQRPETTWSDATHPDSRLLEWLYEHPTLPWPQLSSASDPQTGHHFLPYPPSISADVTYPRTGQNEDVAGRMRAYVDGTGAPPDLISVAPPSAEDRQATDDDEWPSDNAEEWPSSDTGAQPQAPEAAVVPTPNSQHTVQQAMWETQPSRLADSQLYPELGGNKKMEDPRSYATARLPGVVPATFVRPIADNNFILANARNEEATFRHASSSDGSPFEQQSVHRIGANDAILRRHIPNDTAIQNSVVASFGSPVAPENRTYYPYGTNSVRQRPFAYSGQPFDVELGDTYSPRNLFLHVANLSEAQETTSGSATMSDAYPEPLVPGAQYAQIIQQNNAILGNPRIDRTTERLLSILTETVESLGAGSGPIFGIEAHFEFAKRVRALNIPGIREEGVEQSFDLGRIVRYGLDGSVRTDIVLRDRSGIPIAIYDLKTGNAKLTPSRVQELRNAVGRNDVPVIELRYVSQSAILR